MTPEIVIYHHPCPDGFTAAWAIHKRFGDAPTYVPAKHGMEPPDVTGKHVVIVDFSFKRDVLEQMFRKAASLIVIDHHKSAETDLAKVIEEMLPIVRRTMKIGGIDVPVANMPYHMASDCAGAMAMGAPFAATYYDSADGRVFSLRSKPGAEDVSVIAGIYGGGGHKHASGFTMPHGWSGDS